MEHVSTVEDHHTEGLGHVYNTETQHEHRTTQRVTKCIIIIKYRAGTRSPPDGKMVPWHASQMFSSGKDQEDNGYFGYDSYVH